MVDDMVGFDVLSREYKMTDYKYIMPPLARQREQHIKAMEQQQAKQIQEIKDAYEERHRKMSDFVDFVKCYFPSVEKLMPMINFLRDRLRFKDSTIRKHFKLIGDSAGKIECKKLRKKLKKRLEGCY